VSFPERQDRSSGNGCLSNSAQVLVQLSPTLVFGLGIPNGRHEDAPQLIVRKSPSLEAQHSKSVGAIRRLYSEAIRCMLPVGQKVHNGKPGLLITKAKR